jgi:type II secretory pathway pseudopilin PulG
LIEVVVSLLIIMVVLLGVLSVFTYTIIYNAGNKSRSQALTVLQQEVERYRAAKFNAGSPTDNFTPGSTDDGRRDLTGGEKALRTVTTSDGRVFTVKVWVDNDPAVGGLQDEAYQCLSPQGAVVPCTLKEVTIEAKLANPSPGWQTAVPARVVMRRVRGN